MQRYRNTLFFALIVIAGVIAALLHWGSGPASQKPQAPASATGNEASSAEATVALEPSQLSAIKIEPISMHRFGVEKAAVGSIAYHEQDASHIAATTNHFQTKLAIANVAESDSPSIHVGQPVEVRVVAYPDQVFTGKVSALGGNVWDADGHPAVDPNVHRITVHCEINDLQNALYSGMLATIIIQTQPPVESTAIPMNGVVRNGDGSMAAWVTTDHQHFTQRFLTLGLQKDGQYQVLEGLKPGEQAVTDGAVFLSNILYAPPTD